MKKIFILSFVVLLFCCGCSNEFQKSSDENVKKVLKCDKNYDLIDGKCVRILSEEMAYESPYCDEEGYIFDNGKCVMYQYHEPSVNWYCPKGYTMRKENYPDICFKEEVVPRVREYYCKSGYVLNGTKCYYSSSNSVAPIIESSCPGGTLYNSSLGYCIFPGIFANSACPVGYSRIGNYCGTRPVTLKMCPSGTVAKDGLCVSTVESIVDAEYVDYCDPTITVWNQENDTCVKTSYDTPNYKYICNKGYVFKNDTCEKKLSIESKIKYYCVEGELEDNKCVKYDYKEPVVE